MKCDACRKNTATYLDEETKNGETRTYHLCPECAARLSGAQDFPDFEWPFGLFSHNPLEDFFGDLLPLSHGGHAQRQGKTCPGCGSDFSRLQEEGKAICPQCYDTFREELRDTIRQLHGRVTHVGTRPEAPETDAPAGTPEKAAAPEKKAEEAAGKDPAALLREKLAAAVAREDYEEAARLRDEIRDLAPAPDAKKEERK